jgi:hypothetical protein
MTSDRTARRDATFAIAMIAAGALTIWGVRNQPRAPFDPVGAAAIPFWTAIAVIALASILLARIILGHATRGGAVSLFTSADAIDDGYTVEPRYSLAAALCTATFAAALPFAGFRLASIGFMLVLGWLLSDRTPRAVAIVVAVAILGGAGLDAGFRALMIDLP